MDENCSTATLNRKTQIIGGGQNSRDVWMCELSRQRWWTVQYVNFMEMEAYPKYDDKNIPMKLTHLKNGSQILVVAHFVLSFSELILNLNPPNKFYRQK